MSSATDIIDQELLKIQIQNRNERLKRQALLDLEFANDKAHALNVAKEWEVAKKQQEEYELKQKEQQKAAKQRILQIEELIESFGGKRTLRRKQKVVRKRCKSKKRSEKSEKSGKSRRHWNS